MAAHWESYKDNLFSWQLYVVRVVWRGVVHAPRALAARAYYGSGAARAVHERHLHIEQCAGTMGDIYVASAWLLQIGQTGVGLKQGQKGSLYIRAQHCSVLVYLFCLSLWDVHDLYSMCARRVTYSVIRGNLLDWSQLGVLVLTYLIPGHDHLECSPRRDCSRYTRSQSPALRRVVPIHCQSLKETSLWSILPLEASLSAVTFPRGSLHSTDAQLSRHTYTHTKKKHPVLYPGVTLSRCPTYFLPYS